MEQKYIDICIAGNYFSSIGQFKDLIKKLFSGNWTKDTFQDIQELVQLTRAGRVKDWIESFESIDENIGSLLRRTECAEDLSDDEILCELADSCGIKDKFYEAKASLISLAASNTEKRNGSALFTFEFNVFNKCTLSINFSFVVKRKGYDDEVFKQTHNLLRDNFKAAFIVPEFTQADYFLFIDGVGSPVWKNADEKNSGLLIGASITSPSKDNALELNVSGISFKMIRVDGGMFRMGATEEQENPTHAEKPSHLVVVRGFWIGETVVTQQLWTSIMAHNPSHFIGDNLPVERVSWKDCQDFIFKLNQIVGVKFRFPTESEWEFAARGGNQSCKTKYSGSNIFSDVVAVGSQTQVVKQKKPNELGLYDMSGNVNEWCSDWYDKYDGSLLKMINPQGPQNGIYRVCRGGSWASDISCYRVSYRDKYDPNSCSDKIGFRLVLSEWDNVNVDVNSDSHYDIRDNGRITPFCIHKYADGIYIGEWIGEKRHGKGKMEFVNGKKYEGDWVDDKRTGKGVFSWPNGDRYEGDWVDNKMTGKGVYIWSDGGRYEGDWVDNKMTGKGDKTWPNGDRYVGLFKNDYPNGYGTYFYSDGRIQKGLWSNNKFVK